MATISSLNIIADKQAKDCRIYYRAVTTCKFKAKAPVLKWHPVERPGYNSKYHCVFCDFSQIRESLITNSNELDCALFANLNSKKTSWHSNNAGNKKKPITR